MHCFFICCQVHQQAAAAPCLSAQQIQNNMGKAFLHASSQRLELLDKTISMAILLLRCMKIKIARDSKSMLCYRFDNYSNILSKMIIMVNYTCSNNFRAYNKTGSTI